MATPLSACSDGAASEEQVWCDLVEDGGRAFVATKESEEENGTAAPDLAADLEDANRKIQEHGWPESLRAEQKIIGDGPATNSRADLEEYEQALDETERFVLEECDLDADVAAALFGA